VAQTAKCTERGIKINKHFIDPMTCLTSDEKNKTKNSSFFSPFSFILLAVLIQSSAEKMHE